MKPRTCSAADVVVFLSKLLKWKSECLKFLYWIFSYIALISFYTKDGVTIARYFKCLSFSDFIFIFFCGRERGPKTKFFFYFERDGTLVPGCFSYGKSLQKDMKPIRTLYSDSKQCLLFLLSNATFWARDQKILTRVLHFAKLH